MSMDWDTGRMVNSEPPALVAEQRLSRLEREMAAAHSMMDWLIEVLAEVADEKDVDSDLVSKQIDRHRWS